MKVTVTVELKPSVLDPQGKAVARSLAALGYSEIEDVRLGKLIELTLQDGDPAIARTRVEEM
ncbi:MAG: phosphoribosylformylglycinamidine synthase subunit PurS, partial [Thermoanaerobaculia bacterium]